MRSWILSGLLVLFCFIPRGLWAGPPFETDDPEPVDYQHWEIFLGATGVQTSGGFSGTGPFWEFNYGALPDVHVSLAQQLSFNFSNGASGAYGYGDTLIGVKWRFLHETSDLPQAAFYPQMNISSGNAEKGLGSGQDEFLLPLWIQKSWGPWTAFGGAAYWINPGVNNKNWVYVGGALQRDFSPVFTLGGEIFYHGPAQTGQRAGVGFNVGAYLNMDDVNHIVGSVGRDFIQTTYSLTGYLAYQWTL